MKVRKGLKDPSARSERTRARERSRARLKQKEKGALHLCVHYYLIKSDGERRAAADMIAPNSILAGIVGPGIYNVNECPDRPFYKMLVINSNIQL